MIRKFKLKKKGRRNQCKRGKENNKRKRKRKKGGNRNGWKMSQGGSDTRFYVKLSYYLYFYFKWQMTWRKLWHYDLIFHFYEEKYVLLAPQKIEDIKFL